MASGPISDIVFSLGSHPLGRNPDEKNRSQSVEFRILTGSSKMSPAVGSPGWQ